MITNELPLEREILWDEIWREWRKDEENQPFWQNIYQNLQYTSWSEWREKCLEDSDLQQRRWQLYRVNNPLSFAAKSYCCPFTAWYKYYTTSNVPTKAERDLSFFAHIVPATSLSTNEKILGILNQFPRHSHILGVTDGNRVMVYEGHHRCSALTIAYLNNVQLGNIDLFISLSTYFPAEFDKIFYPTTEVGTTHGKK